MLLAASRFDSPPARRYHVLALVSEILRIVGEDRRRNAVCEVRRGSRRSSYAAGA